MPLPWTTDWDDGDAERLKSGDADAPDEMTRLTALPDVTCVPLAGAWLMTDPVATVALDAVVTVPTVRPAVVKVVVAAACVAPTTEGTAIVVAAAGVSMYIFV